MLPKPEPIEIRLERARRQLEIDALPLPAFTARQQYEIAYTQMRLLWNGFGGCAKSAALRKVMGAAWMKQHAAGRSDDRRIRIFNTIPDAVIAAARASFFARRHVQTSKVQEARAFAARWNDADRDGFTLD